jgi:hypothetical protein
MSNLKNTNKSDKSMRFIQSRIARDFPTLSDMVRSSQNGTRRCKIRQYANLIANFVPRKDIEIKKAYVEFEIEDKKLFSEFFNLIILFIFGYIVLISNRSHLEFLSSIIVSLLILYFKFYLLNLPGLNEYLCVLNIALIKLAHKDSTRSC